MFVILFVNMETYKEENEVFTDVPDSFWHELYDSHLLDIPSFVNSSPLITWF